MITIELRHQLLLTIRQRITRRMPLSSTRSMTMRLLILRTLFALLISVVMREALAQLAPEPSRTNSTSQQLSKDVVERLNALDESSRAHWLNGQFTQVQELLEQRQTLLKEQEDPPAWRLVETQRELETVRRVLQLTAEDRAQAAAAEATEDEGTAALDAGRYEAAEALYRDALQTLTRLLGPKNYRVGIAHNNLANAISWQARDTDAVRHFDRAAEIVRRQLGSDHPTLAEVLVSLGAHQAEFERNEDAEANYREALRIRLQALGPDHPDTAISHSALATAFMYQGRWREALPELQQALRITVDTLGPDHRDVLTFRHNLASAYDGLGRYPEAEVEYRSLIEVAPRHYDAAHPAMAMYRYALASNLELQGKLASAESEARQAVEIRMRALGANHPATAQSILALAKVLHAQGRHTEAEIHVRQALSIQLLNNELDEDSQAVLGSRTILAVILNAQEDYANAEAELRKALMQQDQQGRAATHQLLANTYWYQDRLDDAAHHYREALRLRTAAVGADHPDVAYDLLGLGIVLLKRGDAEAAEREMRESLARLHAAGIRQGGVVGAVYSHVARALWAQNRLEEGLEACRAAIQLSQHDKVSGQSGNYRLLGFLLDGLGQQSAALSAWQTAAEIQDANRYRFAATGLGRSMAGKGNAELVAALAREGKFVEAWKAWEAGLARGTLDEFSARQLQPLTAEERSRETDLLGQLQQLRERMNRLNMTSDLGADQQTSLTELEERESQLLGEHAALRRTLEEKYGALAGRPEDLTSIQRAIPPQTAIIGWIDVSPQPQPTRLPLHWACILRQDQSPVFVSLPGSGPAGQWTKEDAERPQQLRDALLRGDKSWRTYAAAVASQRITPLREHLNGIDNLIVQTSPDLAGVPVDVLLSQTPALARITVSYAPSSSILVRLIKERPRQRPRQLLAVADPSYPAPKNASSEAEQTPPEMGLTIKALVSDGNAANSGLQQGDVLLTYHDQQLSSNKEFRSIAPDTNVEHVEVSYWRDGQLYDTKLSPGRLGVYFDQRPPAKALQAIRKSKRALNRGGNAGQWARLPGTRREAQGIASLFGEENATLLLGDDATETKLTMRAQDNELQQWQYLHFATHGVSDAVQPLQSALILGPEATNTEDDEVLHDGRVTARQIVNSWQLDAELVTLSGCETALGRLTESEGHLGFAQALFVKGADTVVLSLWKVDDEATALLMQRLYSNLLGRRDGLNQPMSKAASLAEAKHWLRHLTAADVSQSLTMLDRGTVRPLAAPEPTPRASQREELPFAHPRFWAAFILIGDPF
jgi:CHAT domain-containing protein/Tfp pilus assembly protein PilF